MVLLPQGLVSKTRRLPIATVIIVVMTGFISLIHFDDVKQGNLVFWKAPSRLEYARQAKIHVKKKCAQEQALSFCVGLEEIPIRYYLVPGSIHFIFDQGTNATHLAHLVGFISDELQSQKLQTENPLLFRLQTRAENDKQSFAKKKNLLAGQNVHWLAGLRSLFVHSNWLHLVCNLVILLFLAYPVEERGGAFLFISTYVVSGFSGIMLQAILDPTIFYVIGSSAGVCGVAGALAVYFWKNQAKVFASFFFIKSKSYFIPVYLYSILFLFLTLTVDFFMPFHDVAHIAQFGGFITGGVLAFIHNKIRPLPNYYTYPYELEFLKKSKNNLSQYDRIKVLAEWLYFSPTNMYAFSELAKEVRRSSTNPKVNKVLNKFRMHAFPDVYRLNKRNRDFLKLLPVRWLSWASVGHHSGFLRRLGKQFAEERNFDCAFKMYFLTMNEVGWGESDDSIELFKNFKKASVNSHFMEEITVLKDRHSPFGRFIEKRKGFAVA